MATVSENLGTPTALTITLASLASSTAGVGRQSTLVDNTTNLFLAIELFLNIMVGTTPTANSLLFVYLIRQNNGGTPIADDGAGLTDAGITIVNAKLIDTILVPAATSNVAYKKSIDLTFSGQIPAKWGIAIVNASGVALDATGGNHVCSYTGIKATVA